MRKCLQVSLVYLLRPYQHPTCDEIRKRAFGSHPQCYVKPSDGAVSVCDIGFKNWLQILVTIYSSLTQKEVIGEALVTAGKCFQLYINRIVTMLVSWTKTLIENLKKMVTDLLGSANEKLNNDVCIVVLNSNELTDARLKRSTSFSSSIELLVVPRNKYDLNYNGKSNFTTNELITSFLDHVESGEITYKELEGIELLEYRECEDQECKTPWRMVKAPPPTPNAAAAPMLQYAKKLLLGGYLIVATMIL